MHTSAQPLAEDPGRDTHYMRFLWWVFDALGGRQPCERKYARAVTNDLLDPVDVNILVRYIRFIRQRCCTRMRLCRAFRRCIPLGTIHRSNLLEYMHQAGVPMRQQIRFMRLLADALGYVNVTTKRERRSRAPFLLVFE